MVSDASPVMGCKWWQRTFVSADTAFLTLMCTVEDLGRLKRSGNCSWRITRVQRLTCRNTPQWAHQRCRHAQLIIMKTVQCHALPELAFD